MRPALTLLIALLAFASVSAAEPTASSKEPSKKGWAGGHPDAAKEMNCSGFYNWGPHGDSQDGVEVVPMIKGKKGATEKVLTQIKKSGAKVLLGFNEPEREKQGDTTVEEALELWPRLMATGLRLGSPAPSSDREGQAWLEKFMDGVEKRKLRLDFIAVHWYRSADVDKFRSEEYTSELQSRFGSSYAVFCLKKKK